MYQNSSKNISKIRKNQKNPEFSGGIADISGNLIWKPKSVYFELISDGLTVSKLLTSRTHRNP